MARTKRELTEEAKGTILLPVRGHPNARQRLRIRQDRLQVRGGRLRGEAHQLMRVI